MEDYNVDGGYAWVILAASFLVYMFIMGTRKMFGVMYGELMDIYEMNAGTTSFIGSSASFAALIIGPLSTFLCTRYSFRAVMFSGGLLLGTGYVLSYFVTRAEYFFLTYGVIAGTGCGLILAPCTTIVSFYWEKRRALANGIVLSSGGPGMFAFSYLYRELFQSYGLEGGILIMGGILWNCCAASLLIKQPKQLLKSNVVKSNAYDNDDGTQTNNGKNKALLINPAENSNSRCRVERYRTRISRVKQTFQPHLSLFKNGFFYVYGVSFGLTFLGYVSNLFMLPPHIESLGYSKYNSALSITIIGITEVISRVLMGWFADLKIVSPKIIFFVNMFISGVAAILITFSKNFVIICFYSFIIALFPGSFHTLVPVILVEAFGLQSLPPANGLVSLFIAIIFLSGQSTLGWLEDRTGTWRLSFCMSGVFLILAALLMLFGRVFDRSKENSKEKQKTDSKEDEDISMISNEDQYTFSK